MAASAGSGQRNDMIEVIERYEDEDKHEEGGIRQNDAHTGSSISMSVLWCVVIGRLGVVGCLGDGMWEMGSMNVRPPTGALPARICGTDGTGSADADGRY